MAAARRAHRPGYTLLEVLIVLAVGTVLAAVATPTMTELIVARRLGAVAQGLGADLALGRHEAARRGVTLHLVTQPGTAWCYGLALHPQTDCRGSPHTDPMLVRAVHGADHPGIALLDAQPLWLDPRDAPRPGHVGPVWFGTAKGTSVRVQLSPMGRALACSLPKPTGGLPVCPEGTARPSGPP